MTEQEAIKVIENEIKCVCNGSCERTECQDCNLVMPECDIIAAYTAAINALERMIPVKPYGQHTNRRCGRCGARVRSGAGSSSFTRDTVCRKCFGVIDWGE